MCFNAIQIILVFAWVFIVAIDQFVALVFLFHFPEDIPQTA